MLKSLFGFKQEWMNHPEWWFKTCMETDVYLTKTYGHWLTESMMEYSTDWTKDTVLTWIILYDQLPRHMARVSSEHHPLIYRCLSKAIGLVQWVMQEGFKYSDYTGTEFGFLMLPLRHSYDTRLVFQAMKLTWAKIEADKSVGNHAYIEQLKPFLVATYKRCPPIPLPLELAEYRDYLQWIPAKEPGAPLPVFQWDKHASVIANSPELLLEGEGQPAPPKWASGIVLPSVPPEPVIVSLSGGVDSMVLLWILKTYYPSVPLMAVYINYCNRSDAEEDFVKDWCATHGVSLFVRRFREIQRAPAMAFELRELYETYTKRGRFHAYQLGMAVAQVSPISGVPLVAFGHNQDDCFENILTNICQKKKYDNLRGMEILMETDGIQCWRPLLHVSKEEIYHFAQQHNIPYLQDSTPKWSCRGKIRDIVRPTLQHYHAAMIPAFFHLSDTLSQLTEHLEHTASVLYRKTSPVGILTIFPEDYPASLWLSLPFWQCYFLKLWGFPPSSKSIRHFIERLQKPVVSNETLRVLLKKDILVTVKRSATKWVFEFQFNASSHETPA